MAQLAEDLAHVPLFSDLNKRQLRKLANGFKEKSFAPGRTIVREGHMDGVGFFVVAEGTAAVSVSGSNVAIIGPGDYFGELAMITEQARGATVTAETPLRCLMMAFWDFRRFAKDNPDVSWKLLQHLAGILMEDRARRAQAAIQAS
jgi:CPA1 family monovalent cation:H+ antiporter